MTKEIQLGNGGISLIDDIDYPLISQYKWNKCLKDRRIFYAVHIDHCMINNEKKMITMLMHRVILKLEKGQLCDHINNDGLDNRRCNLRIATPSQNMMNRRKISIFSSKYKGVTWHKQGGCWQSQIRYGGQVCTSAQIELDEHHKCLAYILKELAEEAILANMEMR